MQSYKYLGVLITADLTWSAHLQVISTKTRKLLGMFYRRFYSNSTSTTMLKLYKSFIRPNLENAAVLWDVYHSKDVAILLNVQNLLFEYAPNHGIPVTRIYSQLHLFQSYHLDVRNNDSHTYIKFIISSPFFYLLLLFRSKSDITVVLLTPSLVVPAIMPR